MNERLTKWMPLSAVIMAVLVGIGFVLNHNTPSDKASGGAVIAFYTIHSNDQKVSSVAISIGMVFFILYAATIVRYCGVRSRWLGIGAFGAAVAMAMGGLLLCALSVILASDAKFLSASSAQAINVLANDLFIPLIAAFIGYGVLGGLTVISSRFLPKRWGIVLLILGIAGFVIPIAWFAFLAGLLWSAASGVWMFRRGPVIEEVPREALADINA